MIQPMKCMAVDVAPEGVELIWQPKFDGWRGFAVKKDGEVTLCSSTGKAIGAFPYICEALASLPEGTILDGEIVNLDGSKQWNKAQSWASKRKEIHVPTADDPPLTFVAFDAIEVKGKLLTQEPLEARLQVLGLIYELLEPDPAVTRICEELPGEAASYERLVSEGWEGVVVKRRDSPYIPGGRGPEWLKCKAENEVDVEITGMFDAKAGSKLDGRTVGGFTFVYFHEGKEVHGRCGTGMDDKLRERMLTHEDEFRGRVAVVKHWGIGDTGALRFPSLSRIRDAADKAEIDKPATAEPKSNGMAAMAMEALVDEQLRREALETENAKLRQRLNAVLESDAPVKRATRARGRRIRAYDKMLEPKLQRSFEELRDRRGDAYERCTSEGSGDVERDLRVCRDLLERKFGRKVV